jgi:hypothetical protein
MVVGGGQNDNQHKEKHNKITKQRKGGITI